MSDFTWKVGGAQGEGIESTGTIFGLTLHRIGYYVYQYRHFMSLIKGGHTNFKIRASAEQRRHRGDTLDMLVAFDQRTIDENLYELRDGGIIIYDSAFTAELKEARNVHLLGVPLTEIAKQNGNAQMKNMVSIGASAAVCGLPEDAFDDFIEERWGKRGEKVTGPNKKSVRDGYAYALANSEVRFSMPKVPADAKQQKRVFMHGNDALALGAIVAGCRIVAAYPITPATEILYSVLKLLPKYGGVVLQAEDEMAACQMAVGANYTGVRAMTSTSGPGLSLMTETLGLSGVSETPVVIVDVQRAGPSTGMPTKTEQGDAFTAIYSAHGEIPRIVLAPATVEDCFYDTQRAFNLADQYQCPVIILTDLVLGLTKMSIDEADIDFERVKIDRGAIATPEQLAKAADNGGYKRYELTESGISPRALPGVENGVHIALSYEHDEYSLEMDEPEMRVQQVNKRARKMSTFNPNEWGAHYYGAANPDVLFIGWGATIGPIHESLEQLELDGIKAANLQLTVLEPFPTEAVAKAIGQAKRVVVVDNNSFGQLAELIKRHVGCHDRLHSCLKYNGDPFRVSEILEQTRAVLRVKEAV
ncbi:MAG TPA: 2-oxoacid:acceptor oxidoreductase subunit alpha [Limnochordia bacterium]|nr:2-oxoacid:acceptor oxidoreductase subunit alpha [Limnochordia bacterium]